MLEVFHHFSVEHRGLNLGVAQLTNLVATTDPLPDLSDLAPAIRQLFPEPAYRVGCGGAHIWLARADDPQLLALIC